MQLVMGFITFIRLFGAADRTEWEPLRPHAGSLAAFGPCYLHVTHLSSRDCRCGLLTPSFTLQQLRDGVVKLGGADLCFL